MNSYLGSYVRRPGRRLLAVTASLVAVAIAASACGSPASTPRTTATPSEATLAWPQAMISMDPLSAYSNQSTSTFHLIGGNLFELRGRDTVPALAESGTEADDGMSWTFTLQKDLTFSDGSPLTSADVVASFDRGLTFEGNLYAGLFAAIDAVSASDSLTVVVKLKKPYPSLPTILGLPPFMVFPEDGLKNEDKFFELPISAGPYVLSSWDEGDSTLERNETYAGPEPVLSTLNQTTITDLNSRSSQLQSGQIDAAIDLSPSSVEQLNADSQISASVEPMYGFASLNMWNDTPPLDDPNVRKAISLSIDRERIVDSIWPESDIKPMAGFWPSSMAGYDEAISVSQDLDEAQRLIADSSCASGCTLTLDSTEAFPWIPQVALMIQSDLEQIGVKTKINSAEFQVWADNLVNGKYELSVSNLYDFADVPDGMIAYGLLDDGGANANYTAWDSAPVEAAANAAIINDGEKRTEALAEINSVFEAEMPYATLATYGVVFATRLPEDTLTLSPGQVIDVQRTP